MLGLEVVGDGGREVVGVLLCEVAVEGGEGREGMTGLLCEV